MEQNPNGEEPQHSFHSETMRVCQLIKKRSAQHQMFVSLGFLYFWISAVESNWNILIAQTEQTAALTFTPLPYIYLTAAYK